MFTDRLSKIQTKTNGKLIIKEYPTASAHTGHFRSLIKELALKKSFRPDIIFIDYLNICASSRFKGNANVGSYFYIKAIAEELRGLAVENNVPIMSATQTTRGGYANSDIGMEDTSESFGLSIHDGPHVCSHINGRFGKSQPTNGETTQEPLQ